MFGLFGLLPQGFIDVDVGAIERLIRGVPAAILRDIGDSVRQSDEPGGFPPGTICDPGPCPGQGGRVGSPPGGPAGTSTSSGGLVISGSLGGRDFSFNYDPAGLLIGGIGAEENNQRPIPPLMDDDLLFPNRYPDYSIVLATQTRNERSVSDPRTEPVDSIVQFFFSDLGGTRGTVLWERTERVRYDREERQLVLSRTDGGAPTITWTEWQRKSSIEERVSTRSAPGRRFISGSYDPENGDGYFTNNPWNGEPCRGFFGDQSASCGG